MLVHTNLAIEALLDLLATGDNLGLRGGGVGVALSLCLVDDVVEDTPTVSNNSLDPCRLSLTNVSREPTLG